MLDAVEHWGALKKWTNDYLRGKIGDLQITVDVTPSGFGDAVYDDKYFVQPEERKMKFAQYLDILEKKVPSEGVFYVSHQNGNLSSEFDPLIEDIDSDIAWASEAFGEKPDAINLWMGEDRSVSSLHKDHYENMYVVVAGEKYFTLLPPTYNSLHLPTI